jgi:hypothetical protein
MSVLALAATRGLLVVNVGGRLPVPDAPNWPLWGQVSHMKKSRPDQAERGSEPRRRSPKSGGKIRWVRHNPRDKAARLPSSTDAGYQALLLGRRVGAGNSPAGVDLTGMSNPNIPRENPDAPLT